MKVFLAVEIDDKTIEVHEVTDEAINGFLVGGGESVSVPLDDLEPVTYEEVKIIRQLLKALSLF